MPLGMSVSHYKNLGFKFVLSFLFSFLLEYTGESGEAGGTEVVLPVLKSLTWEAGWRFGLWALARSISGCPVHLREAVDRRSYSIFLSLSVFQINE